jgi:hypothetical protein
MPSTVPINSYAQIGGRIGRLGQKQGANRVPGPVPAVLIGIVRLGKRLEESCQFGKRKWRRSRESGGETAGIFRKLAA